MDVYVRCPDCCYGNALHCHRCGGTGFITEKQKDAIDSVVWSLDDVKDTARSVGNQLDNLHIQMGPSAEYQQGFKDAEKHYKKILAEEQAVRNGLQRIIASHEYLLAKRNIDGNCFYCGKKTNSLIGNPNAWPIYLPRQDGVSEPHHIGCVIDRLIRFENIEKVLENEIV